MDRTTRTLTGTALALLLGLGLLAGCGDDGSDTDGGDAGAGTDGTTAPADGGSASEGDVVDVPAAPPLGEFDAFVPGTPVEVGQVADMGAIRVVVEGFEPGPTSDAGATTIDVEMVVDNVVDGRVFVPDVYTVCAADGRGGIATTAGDLEILAPLDAGEVAEGTMNVEVVDGCDDLLLQVLSQNETSATPPIAEYTVPPDVLG